MEKKAKRLFGISAGIILLTLVITPMVCADPVPPCYTVWLDKPYWLYLQKDGSVTKKKDTNTVQRVGLVVAEIYCHGVLVSFIILND